MLSIKETANILNDFTHYCITDDKSEYVHIIYNIMTTINQFGVKALEDYLYPDNKQIATTYLADLLRANLISGKVINKRGIEFMVALRYYSSTKIEELVLTSLE